MMMMMKMMVVVVVVVVEVGWMEWDVVKNSTLSDLDRVQNRDTTMDT
jgi:hypothetical protein